MPYLEEFGGDVFIHGVVLGQLEGDIQPMDNERPDNGKARVYIHVQAIEGHPCCPVSLTQRASSWKGFRAVEDTNVVKAKEATFEDVLAIGVLSIHPPGEVEEQLLEDTLQKVEIFTSI